MKVLFLYAIHLRPVPHHILSFPSLTLYRNGTTATAILNVFLLPPLDIICLDVIRTVGGLGTVEKDTKAKTRIKTGVHKNHSPITTNSVTEKLDSASPTNIDPYTTPTPATFGIRVVDVKVTRTGIYDEANRTDNENLEGDNDRTAKACANSMLLSWCTAHSPTTQQAKHDVLAKSRNTCPGTGWAESTGGSLCLTLSRVRGQNKIIHTTGKSLGVSSNPFSSLKGGNQGTGVVAGTQADPSRPDTRRCLRYREGYRPATTTTTTLTPIDMADGSRETKALEGLKWGKYNHPPIIPSPFPCLPLALFPPIQTLC